MASLTPLVANPEITLVVREIMLHNNNSQLPAMQKKPLQSQK